MLRQGTPPLTWGCVQCGTPTERDAKRDPCPQERKRKWPLYSSLIHRRYHNAGAGPTTYILQMEKRRLREGAER